MTGRSSATSPTASSVDTPRHRNNEDTLDLTFILFIRLAVLFLLPQLFSNTYRSMAINARAYPRATVKKIVKGHANKSLSRDVDALVCCVAHRIPSLLLWLNKHD